ncbi:MAG: metal ABC transporter substrate-binding protein [Cellvibrionaceae bacterium]
MIKPFKLLMGVVSLLASSHSFAALNILACEPEWKALAEEIGGQHVVAHSATTAFQDPHHIEARPSLIAKARKADMVFCAGSELEIGWLPLLLRQSGNPSIQTDEPGYLMASDHVKRLDIPTVLDRSQGDIHAAGNPHVHLDPYRLLAIADVLYTRLKEVDQKNADTYLNNLNDFKQRWKKSIQVWEVKTKGLKGKEMVVYHKNWTYLFDWLGVQAVGDLEPKPGLPPTSKHLSALLSQLKQRPADAILYASYQPSKSAVWLSKRSGVSAIELPFTVGASKQIKTLFDLMDSIVDQLSLAVTP